MQSATIGYIIKNHALGSLRPAPADVSGDCSLCEAESWSEAVLERAISSATHCPDISLVVKTNQHGDSVCLFCRGAVSHDALTELDSTHAVCSCAVGAMPSAGGHLPQCLVLRSEGLTLPILYRTIPVVAAEKQQQQQQQEQEMENRTNLLPSAAALDSPLLIVGAGGIGCELLKVLVLGGFTNLHLLDLDTIDATNLNRQFLFGPKDVGRPKAVVAREAVLSWRRAQPSLRITAYHDDIKSDRYDSAFFSQFTAVLNALDNVSARQHVNRRCMESGIPLIESGTMGYNGQVQPILRGRTECYDCRPKPPDQKTFAVCTIHARPTTMVHCVHYSKELYSALFGQQAAEAAAVDPANREEEERVREAAQGELQHWRRLVDACDKGSSSVRLSRELLEGLFCSGIEQLLRMKSEWSTTPPTPIPRDVIAAALEAPVGENSGSLRPFFAQDSALSVTDSIRLFAVSVCLCRQRPPVDFHKEDDVAVALVAAVSNLRAEVFHIPRQSVEELRSIAGSIIPAIATTNAIVAAGVVQQLTVVLQCPERVQMLYVRRVPQTTRRALHGSVPALLQERVAVGGGGVGVKRPRDGGGGKTSSAGGRATDHYLVHCCPPVPPSRDCPVCQLSTPTVTVRGADIRRVTLKELVTGVLQQRLGMEGPSVSHGPNVIYEDEDYEELGDRTLPSLLPAESAAKWLTLHVDALNRDSTWKILIDCQCIPNGDAGEWSVDGLAEALAVEKRLADAKAERDREQEEKKAAAKVQATAAVTDLVSEDDDSGDHAGDDDGVIGGEEDSNGVIEL